MHIKIVKRFYGAKMNEQEKDGLLKTLTQLSDSEMVREYEASFLNRVSRIMNNRHSFLINAQRITAQPSFEDILATFNKNNSTH